MPATALQGTTVLELSDGIAGAFCGRLLAQYGAEVIKAESPRGGDRSRHAGPFPGDEPHPERSGQYLYLNGNKLGITLNLSHASGRELARRLIAESDVLIESFSPSETQALGLGYDELSRLNPGLVMVSVTPFGQSGPYSGYAATDLITHAVGGWLYASGLPNRPPLKPGGSLAEYNAGLVAAVGCMTALSYRNHTGIGQQVDVSAMEALLCTTPFPTVRFAFSGMENRRSGHSYPFTIMPCKDGYIGVNILTQRQWEDMCRFMDMPELIDEPEFRTGAERQRPEAVQAITEHIRPWLMARTAREIFLEGQRRRIPFSLVPTTAELTAFSQHQERRYFVEVDHPIAGRTLQPGMPVRFGETGTTEHQPAPLLGEHNARVYGERLGCTRDDLTLLARAGVI
jgi:crotonobetainyl-CoA:carnitine CoA-transferase CaiB-like acyl-CoA transferase